MAFVFLINYRVRLVRRLLVLIHNSSIFLTLKQLDQSLTNWGVVKLYNHWLLPMGPPTIENDQEYQIGIKT